MSSDDSASVGSSDDANERRRASPPLLQRLEHEHELDMQRRRSETVVRELKAEAKTAHRALQKEERAAHALRAECAALQLQLQLLQQQHAALVQQNGVLQQAEAAQAKEGARLAAQCARLAAQRKEGAARLAAEREQVRRADHRAAEQAQLVATERTRAEAQERALEATRGATLKVEQLQERAVHQERERGRVEEELRHERARVEELKQLDSRVAEAAAQAELRRAEAAMWRERAGAAEARAAEAELQLARAETQLRQAGLDEARAAEAEEAEAEARRQRGLAQIRSRRRAAQWYLLHWVALRASDAFYRWAAASRLLELEALGAAHAALRAEHGAASTSLAQAAMLGGLRSARAGDEMLRLLAAGCFGHWAERTRRHERCLARWRALVRQAELSPALGADGWRARLANWVLRERERRKLSLWRQQHLVFNTNTMRRVIFALWRMWAQGTLLHEWVKTTEARHGNVHFAEREWWLEE